MDAELPKTITKIDDFDYVIIETNYTSRLLKEKYLTRLIENLMELYWDLRHIDDELDGIDVISHEASPVFYIKDHLWGKHNDFTEITFKCDSDVKYLKKYFIEPLKLDGIICLKSPNPKKKLGISEAITFINYVLKLINYCHIHNSVDSLELYEHESKKVVVITCDSESG